MTNEALKFPKNILDLTTEEKRNFLDSFDLIFSDIDGVLWNLHKIVPGAAEAFHNFRNAGKMVHFITNNSVYQIQKFEILFKKFGFDYDPEDIIYPAKNVIEYLKSINFDGLIYILGSDNFKELLSSEGFQFIDAPNMILDESPVELINAVKVKDPVRAVIMDHDPNMCYLKLLRAYRYLQNPECLFIKCATDEVCPLGDGVTFMGPGVFSKLIAEVCNREPIVLGKPGKEMAQQLIKRFNIENKKRVLMIGDMLTQDVGFGNICGFQTLLVLSGGSTWDDLKAETNAQFLPDYYANSMGDFVEFMKDLHRSNV